MRQVSNSIERTKHEGAHKQSFVIGGLTVAVYGHFKHIVFVNILQVDNAMIKLRAVLFEISAEANCCLLLLRKVVPDFDGLIERTLHRGTKST